MYGSEATEGLGSGVAEQAAVAPPAKASCPPSSKNGANGRSNAASSRAVHRSAASTPKQLRAGGGQAPLNPLSKPVTIRHQRSISDTHADMRTYHAVALSHDPNHPAPPFSPQSSTQQHGIPTDDNNQWHTSASSAQMQLHQHQHQHQYFSQMQQQQHRQTPEVGTVVSAISHSTTPTTSTPARQTPDPSIATPHVSSKQPHVQQRDNQQQQMQQQQRQQTQPQQKQPQQPQQRKEVAVVAPRPMRAVPMQSGGPWYSPGAHHHPHQHQHQHHQSVARGMPVGGHFTSAMPWEQMVPPAAAMHPASVLPQAAAPSATAPSHPQAVPAAFSGQEPGPLPPFAQGGRSLSAPVAAVQVAMPVPGVSLGPAPMGAVPQPFATHSPHHHSRHQFPRHQYHQRHRHARGRPQHNHHHPHGSRSTSGGGGAAGTHPHQPLTSHRTHHSHPHQYVRSQQQQQQQQQHDHHSGHGSGKAAGQRAIHNNSSNHRGTKSHHRTYSHHHHHHHYRPQHRSRPRKTKPQARKMTKLQQRLEQSTLNVNAEPFVPSNLSRSESDSPTNADSTANTNTNSTNTNTADTNTANNASSGGSTSRNAAALVDGLAGMTLGSESVGKTAARTSSPSHELRYTANDADEVMDGHDLLQNYLYHKYLKFLERALQERRRLGCGRSPLVRSLYQFWVARLQHKFNRNMYQTFKDLALEDNAVAGSREGIECLYRFLRGSLSTTYRERVFRDFIYLVGTEAHEDSFGLEQLWLFLRERSDDIRRRSQHTVERRIMSRLDLASALKELDRFHALSLE